MPRGFTQVEVIDYNETYAPVVKYFVCTHFADGGDEHESAAALDGCCDHILERGSRRVCVYETARRLQREGQRKPRLLSSKKRSMVKKAHRCLKEMINKFLTEIFGFCSKAQPASVYTRARQVGFF